MPLANLMVDRLQGAGVLNRGAAYWYGRALRMGAKSPLEAVERLTALPAEKLAPLPPEEERKLRDEVRAEARAAVDELQGAHRPARRARARVPHAARRRTSTSSSPPATSTTTWTRRAPRRRPAPTSSP